MFNQMGLSNRLNLIVIVINAIVLAIVAVLAVVTSDAALRTQALDRFATKNAEASQSINTLLQNVFDTANGMAIGLDTVEDLSDSVALRAYATDFVQHDADTLIHRVSIVRPDGSVAVLDIPDPDIPTDYSWRVHRSATMIRNVDGIADTLYSSEPHWFRQPRALYDPRNRQSISLAVGYQHPSSDGTLWVDIPLDVFSNELSNILNAEGLLADTVNGYGILFSERNVALATFNLPEVNRFERVAQSLTRRLENAPRDTNGLYTADDPFNDEASGLFASNRLPVNNWTFVSVLPVAEIPVLPSGVLIPVAIVATIGIVLLILAVNRFISQSVVMPMTDLQRSAREIGEGNLRFVVFHRDKADEIGQLARAMESMKNRLRESYDDLQTWSRTLETRVEERTQQLSVAQKASQKAADQLRAIYDESLSVVNEVQLRTVLDQFMERIISLLDATFVSIWLGTPDDENLQLVATNDPRPRRGEGAVVIPRRGGLAGQTILKGEPIIVDDYDTYPHRVNLSDYYDGSVTFSQALAVPLLFAGTAIGTVTVGRPADSPPFTESDTRQLTLFSNLVSPSVRNAQLFVQLREAVQEAERANEVKTRFLASVTHELRTPLNLIINNMDFMRVGAFGEVNDEQISRLNQTVRSAEHLLYLINDLLDVSKIEAGEMQLFIQMNDVYTMLDDAVDNAYALLDTYEEKENVELVVEVEEDLPELPTDTRRIRQVLNNLLSNAIKFTSEGAVTLSVQRADEGVRFSVSDTGIGIPADEVDKLFVAFERTDAAKESNIEGTGLGLPISRFMVQRHGGDIHVTSTAGAGSTFSFILPYVAPEDETQADRKQAMTNTQQITALLSSRGD
jgi:signal transduction histidine kinase/HAMP domain-containing protein